MELQHRFLRAAAASGLQPTALIGGSNCELQFQQATAQSPSCLHRGGSSVILQNRLKEMFQGAACAGACSQHSHGISLAVYSQCGRLPAPAFQRKLRMLEFKLGDWVTIILEPKLPLWAQVFTNIPQIPASCSSPAGRPGPRSQTAAKSLSGGFLGKVSAFCRQVRSKAGHGSSTVAPQEGVLFKESPGWPHVPCIHVQFSCNMYHRDHILETCFFFSYVGLEHLYLIFLKTF